jgi:hypothetical protein
MKLCSLFVLFFLAAASFGQTSLRSGPKVNGIGLGAAEAALIRSLGKPVSATKKKADECVGGTEMTMVYPGLRFSLWDDPDDAKKFSVGAFEVTGVTWKVSGAEMGNSEEQIRKIFGPPTSEEQGGSGQKTLFYEMDEKKSPGSTGFTFVNGMLVKVTAMWLMC